MEERGGGLYGGICTVYTPRDHTRGHEGGSTYFSAGSTNIWDVSGTKHFVVIAFDCWFLGSTDIFFYYHMNCHKNYDPKTVEYLLTCWFDGVKVVRPGLTCTTPPSTAPGRSTSMSSSRLLPQTRSSNICSKVRVWINAFYSRVFISITIFFKWARGGMIVEIPIIWLFYPHIP